MANRVKESEEDEETVRSLSLFSSADLMRSAASSNPKMKSHGLDGFQDHHTSIPLWLSSIQQGPD